MRKKKKKGKRITCLSSERDEYRWKCKYMYYVYTGNICWITFAIYIARFFLFPLSEKWSTVRFHFWAKKKLSSEKAFMKSVIFPSIWFASPVKLGGPPPDSRIWLFFKWTIWLLNACSTHLNIGARPWLWANSSSVICSLFRRHRLASISVSSAR